MNVRRAAMPVWRVVVIGVALVSPAACGSGGSDRASTASAPVVARAEWATRLDADCKALNQEYAELSDASPSNRSEAVDHADAVEDYADALVTVLHDAGVPSADRAAADQMTAAADRLAAAAAELARDAERGDSDGVAAAVDEIRDAGLEINELAASLDVPTCGGF